MLAQLALLAAAAVAASAAPITVACIGDSLTSGSCGTKGWPIDLQALLGANYAVTNFGAPGSTMLKKGRATNGNPSSYWNRTQWPAAQAAQADIYTIQLGSNDAKSFNWLPCTAPGGVTNCSWIDGDNFTADFLEMVAILKAQPNSPKVFAITPPPAYGPNDNINATVVNYVLPLVVPAISQQSAAEKPAIDVFNALGGANLTMPDVECDGSHPTAKGNSLEAAAVYEALTAAAASGGWGWPATAAPTAPQQVHLTLHADPDTLVVAWHSLEAVATASAVAYGPTAASQPHHIDGTASSYFVYPVDSCPTTSSRATHFVAFPAPRHADTYYRVSGDGGATWSPVFGPARAPAPAADGSVAISLFGDLGIETAPAPNSVAALTNATATGKHQLVIHFGDTAYNMMDECGAKGDRFLNAAMGYATRTPVLWGNGNHETGPTYDYTEFTNRLAVGQASLAAAANSTSVRWVSAFIPGTAAIFMIDADAWIYPEVWHFAQPQWEWLARELPKVNRAVYPWLLLIPHRALYCTKVADDGECNSEAEALRYGQLGLYWGLEQLCIKYGVDLVFAGHTHHYEVTWPVKNATATQKDYVNPRATVHVQSGIAGTGPGGDPFDVPQQDWERIRDKSFSPSYGTLLFHNSTALTYQQRFAANGSVFDSFVLVQEHRAPFA